MVEKVEKSRKSRTYIVLIAMSIVFIGAYYLLMLETEKCDAASVQISSHWFHGFWDQYLACRSINELGDALAGAFAPVAFIWLAGTVFIQSQELQAQRQELDETQEVMREQIEVARQQVEETKASTELLKEQTRILRRQQDQREAEIADDDFEGLVSAFFDFALDRKGVPISIFEYYQAEISIFTLTNADFVAPNYPAENGKKWARSGTTVSLVGLKDIKEKEIQDVCRDIRNSAAKIISSFGRDDRIATVHYSSKPVMDDINALVARLESLKLQAERGTHALQNRLGGSLFVETIEGMNDLANWIEKAVGRYEELFPA